MRGLFQDVGCALMMIGIIFCMVWGVAATPQALELLVASDTVRVFEDGYDISNRVSRLNALTLFGIRGEIISAQFVLKAKQELRKVKVMLEPMQQSSGSGVIPVDSLEWNFVHGVTVLTNTPRINQRDLTRSAPARFPDVLSEDAQCDLASGQFKAVYLTIRIPAIAAAGEYYSKVTVTAYGCQVVLPFVLMVYPLDMPEERHLKVVEWFTTRKFKKFHGVEPGDKVRHKEILRAYIKNRVEHRINSCRVALDYVKARLDKSGGELNFDFADFDDMVMLNMEQGHIDVLETGFIAHHSQGGWSSREIKFRPYYRVPVGSSKHIEKVDGEHYLAAFLPALVKHLRSKGWLDMTLFHICDEPANHNILSWQYASDFVHRHAPELHRMDAIESPHCRGHLEVLVPKLNHLAAWHEVFEEAQRKGNELWFYTVGIYQSGSLMNKTLDMPLIDTRLMHWLNYRYNLAGYLHWGYNSWTDDPFNDAGKHRGDGWHVYPKRDGVLNSLRWEQMRNGLQDYEYLWLLEDKIRQKVATLSQRATKLIDPRRRSQEIASQVVSSYTEYSRDPALLYAARQQVLNEIMALDTSPSAIIQTIPAEHELIMNQYSIDVHGWAEPGSIVTVNGGGKRMVEADGVFFHSGKVEQTSGVLSVTVENNGCKHEIKRKFRIGF